MHLHERLDTLLRIADQLGIEVRTEPMDGSGGGLCVLSGRKVLFIDATAESELQYEKVLSELARLPELESLYIVPEVREDLDMIRRDHA